MNRYKSFEIFELDSTGTLKEPKEDYYGRQVNIFNEYYTSEEEAWEAIEKYARCNYLNANFYVLTKFRVSDL